MSKDRQGKWAIGLDIGGTKIAGLVMDGAGKAIAHARGQTHGQDYAAHLSEVARVVADLVADSDCAADVPIGISQAGLVSDCGNDIFAYKLPCLAHGRPADDLAARLKRKVTIINDANAFILSELHDGAAKGADCPFGAILGTGVGGGFVSHGPDGRLQASLPAEWGEIPVPGYIPDHPSRLCDVVAGPALEQVWRDSGGDADMLATEIGAAALTGDALAIRLMERYWTTLAMGLATVVNLMGPDRIIFGGSLSTMPGLIDQMAARIPRHTVAHRPAPPLALAQHGPESGARGAAWLAMDGLRR